ncbi:phosphoribosyltransferase [Sessilibacter corallicola]|uniref:Phosphoribosyltransferase family protein n=1 Tax=Sessilibacter corallicola TaxID=2904075 RepID=A0ABQ0AAM4_9GAMM|nr:phosphoribosyltransferase family protein [Sessilibacter corallicola]MCE2029098.1 hypoxanthine phosphoribosyltransferase [Sessilibacter corallicola]
MADKLYLSSQQLLEDSFKLGAQVLASGFRPKVIIALWRGGTPIGIAVQEFIDYYGNCQSDHIAIRTSSYSGIGERSDNIRIHGLNYLLKNINYDDPLLIVDDVFDTGRTIDALIKELKNKTKKNCPQDIRVAVPYYKPKSNLTDRVPDYYLHETEQWLKFPFSLEGLTVDEIKKNRPKIYEIIGDLLEDDQ